MPREFKILKQKLDLVNWETVQEAMRILVIFAFLWLALYQVAYADEVLNQDRHTRTIMFEGWSGGYIKSEYDATVGTLYFIYCDGKIDTCNRIGEAIAIDNIEHYDAILLKSLKALRVQLAQEIDSQLWSFITGGSSRNPDIQSLDELIADLEAGGIEKLVLLTEENIREESPVVSSPEMAERLVKAIGSAFGSL